VESGLLLDVVVAERAAVLELLAGEDEALLVGGDALLVLRGVELVKGKGERKSARGARGRTNLDLGLDLFEGVGLVRCLWRR